MSRSLFWFFILFWLPDSGIADEKGLLAGANGLADETVSASDSRPLLDLRFDPALTPTQPLPSAALSPGPPDAGPASPPRFSLGLDLRTRHEVGDEAREDSSGTLTEEVTGIVRRSTFGLKGTYRF